LSRAWRPGSGATVRCCDIADCRVAAYREIADHYEVLIDERFPGVLAPGWHRVAPEAVPVACWHQGEVLCFVRPEEA
jgi:hypothetical protein